jgi:hypothetical protein
LDGFLAGLRVFAVMGLRPVRFAFSDFFFAGFGFAVFEIFFFFLAFVLAGIVCQVYHRTR